MTFKRRLVLGTLLAVGLTLASLLFSDSLIITDDQSTPGTAVCSYSVAGISTKLGCDMDVKQTGWPLPVLLTLTDDPNNPRTSLSEFALADFALAFAFSFALVVIWEKARRSRLDTGIPAGQKRTIGLGLLLAVALTFGSLLYRAPYHAPVYCIDMCGELNDPGNLNAVGLGWPERILTLDDNDSINLATLEPSGLGTDFFLALIVGLGATTLIAIVRK